MSGRVHVRALTVTVNVQVTLVDPALVAVSVTVVPFTKPDRSMVGDETLVRRSELDDPLSLAVARVGVGAAIWVHVYVDGEETLPAASVAVMTTV